MKLPLTAVLVALLALSTMAKQAQAQCPTESLESCLPAALDDVQPSGTCCAALKPYLAAGVACMCQAASSLTDYQYALLIPSKCKLVYKAGTNCNGHVIPGGY